MATSRNIQVEIKATVSPALAAMFGTLVAALEENFVTGERQRDILVEYLLGAHEAGWADWTGEEERRGWEEKPWVLAAFDIAQSRLPEPQ